MTRSSLEPPRLEPIDRRFARHVRLVGECWRWTGSVNVWGCPTFKLWNRTALATRVAFLLYGPCNQLEPGVRVRRRCDEPLCVNPQHHYRVWPAVGKVA
jgi:hypothetical protein